MDFNNSKNDLKSGIAKTYKEQEKIHDAPLINAANVPIESELKGIEGLSIYDQRTLEDGVLQQVNNAFDDMVKYAIPTLANSDVNSNIDGDALIQNSSMNRNLHDTENEKKIKSGEMTPFGSTIVTEVIRTCDDVSADEIKLHKLASNKSLSLREKVRNFKKRKCKRKIQLGTRAAQYYCSNTKSDPMLSETTCIDFEEEDSGSEYLPSDEDSYDDDNNYNNKTLKNFKGKHLKSNNAGKKRKRKNRKFDSDEEWHTDDTDWESSDPSIRARKINISDDGDERLYEQRIKQYETENNGGLLEYHMLDNIGYKIPQSIWQKLYKYQKIGIQWLYELYVKEIGGILGDEMGLGKSIQTIAFLSGLHCSKLQSSKRHRYAASLIVCPVTLMHQWVNEFHTWFPPIRVAVLHQSGNFTGSRNQLIHDIYASRGILITSYAAVIKHKDALLRYKWNYIILDEGHKISNPDSQITLTIKQFCTVHRLILSGSPMQNNLKELWSLLDFVCPGKLGTLPIFLSTFSDPIVQGGYINASTNQVATAYKCAITLKDLIAPYLLRRMKSDVMSHLCLPKKTERVLFCRLTDIQADFYRQYINSDIIETILRNSERTFTALITLRKICNHPDLFAYDKMQSLLDNAEANKTIETECFGHWSKSGKMIVIHTLLKLWKKDNHKVLLFSQGVKMLKILEAFLLDSGYVYLKLDGTTTVNSRQALIGKFNTDPSIFVMLLTTRVGGLGVNLTGADRVLIYDPDWNPSVDTQAKERAWRIGQQRDVIIYRLLTAGTVEEKIYHRQIFKQMLTNKILTDPSQCRFFKSNDLLELFEFKDTYRNGLTETASIFAGTGAEININKIIKRNRRGSSKYSEDAVKFSPSKLSRMKKLAQLLSRKITDGSVVANPECTSANPECTSANPECTNANPECTSADPECTSTNPESTSANPVCTSANPESTSTNPECTSANPECTSGKYDVNSISSNAFHGDQSSTVIESVVNTQHSDGGPVAGVATDAVNVDVNTAAAVVLVNDATAASVVDTAEIGCCKEKLSSSSVKISADYHQMHDRNDRSPTATDTGVTTTGGRKRKFKHTELEDKDIPYLVRCKLSKSNDEVVGLLEGNVKNESSAKLEHQKSKQDSYILEKLFSKSGVCSVLSHDKIVNNTTSDYALTEHKAANIAKQAIEMIEKSRHQCFRADEGIPNWTGQHGRINVNAILSKGRIKNSSVSSSEILSAINKRNCTAKPTSYEVDLANQIIDFVRLCSGKCETEDLLYKFRNKLPVEHTALFKSLLLSVCKFHKISKTNKKAYWELKPEFCNV